MQLKALRAGLRSLLEDRSMSVDHLAFKSGLSVSTILNFMNGKNDNIGLRNLFAIFNGLGCDIEIGILSGDE